MCIIKWQRTFNEIQLSSIESTSWASELLPHKLVSASEKPSLFPTLSDTLPYVQCSKTGNIKHSLDSPSPPSLTQLTFILIWFCIVSNRIISTVFEQVKENNKEYREQRDIYFIGKFNTLYENEIENSKKRGWVDKTFVFKNSSK